MGFWSNLKQKREEKKCALAEDVNECLEKVRHKHGSRRARADYSKALEENDKARFNHAIVEDIDAEIKRTCQQLDDLIEDPHIHSQGFISPKQGVHVFAKELVERNTYIPETEKKKPRHKAQTPSN
ncbi:hypothetical protein JN01_0342 [Entomoplasma freundtii]|uniref:Small ribosomal subunit protein uS4 N-terminal domain-containing protein n=1 Tax=Entomoplasma freundtii TaxID=74700 RepID=A0A2K8NRS5_9MOLU|nr:hypothetical protein [Entomoplasma freundtii]ATZ16246.1 hypothetical protein EFREU_v1c02190 [Entomoplasma freundtii]TDY56853.1 hypothetical protein JN01_0342 [Entomoplasma freundtii]